MDGREPDGLPDQLLDAAISHASYRVPLAAPGQTAASVRKGLLAGDYATAAEIVVLDGRRLVGLARIERVLTATDNTTMAEIMDPDPPVVEPHRDQEQVAWKMVEHGESSVAVVDERERFVGLISPHRMLAVLLREHDEDLARLGGYLRGTAGARQAAEERLSQRVWHRLPWLLIGLVGALAAAVIVGAFESDLRAVLLLTFFLPGVVYLADAVGTQTEAILIRGLSAGIDLRKTVRRELASGAVIGLIVGAAFLPLAAVGWGNWEVAVAVSLALFCACTIATAVAMGLPIVFQHAGIDPAFGSGPLATVIQDLLTITVYLAIAAPIAT
jgi:magnesium transporter